MNVFNFFAWPPRIQGFMCGVALMTLASVLDTVFTLRCR